MTDRVAREEIFHEHSAWAETVADITLAKHPRRFSLDREDARQEALIGLWEAAGKYQPEFGVRFTTFAIHAVRGRVLDHLRTVARNGMTARRGTMRLIGKLPSRYPLQLSAITILDNEGKLTHFDPPQPEPCRLHPKAEDLLDEVLRRVSPNARRLIRERIEGAKLREIAARRGVTESRVSDLMSDAISEAQAAFRRKTPVTYRSQRSVAPPPIRSRKTWKTDLETIRESVQRHGGNVKAAAAELGVHPNTIYSRLGATRMVPTC